MVAIDVASTIAEFVADPTRTSFEFPHATTGRRKQTKMLVQQYPQLRCESYGFGSERQLHLFKEEERIPVAPQEDLATLDMHHCFPAKLPVRNTFIHIGCSPIDDRAVQSMPHGMFRQCMIAEITCRADKTPAPIVGADVTRAPTPVSEPESEPAARPEGAKPQVGQLVGALVVVEGLTKAPGFNGLSAVVQGWDEASARYSILIVTPAGQQQAKVKEENLRLLCPSL